MTPSNSLVIADRIALSIADNVAEVRLARGDRMNALDGAMFEALAECLARLDRSTARAVVLSGEGRSFCAGLDMQMFGAMLADEPPIGIPADLAPRTHGIANLPQHVAMGWRALPMPVIAAVHGVAVGGGLQLMLGADIRIVAPDARLALREVAWGLVPDMGAFALLPASVRDDRLRLLLYTGKEVGGADAVACGLATECATDPRQAALAFAREIARASPAAVRAAKRLANAALPDPRGILLLESVEQQRLIGGEEQRAVLATALGGGGAVKDRPA